MFFVFAILGYSALAVVTLFDKVLVSGKTSAASPANLTVISSVPLVIVALAIPFGITFPGTGGAWSATIVSGVSFTVALYTMYRGFRGSEISHAGPLVGSLTTLGALIIAPVVLVESISLSTIFGIILLAVGSFIISYEQTGKKSGWQGSVLVAALAGGLFALSNVTGKIAYGSLGFWSGLVLTKTFAGLAGLAFVPQMKQKHPERKKPTPRSWWVMFGLDKTLGLVGVLLVQYAISIGSVSVVTALAGAEYAVLVVGVAVLSKKLPRFFREHYAPHEFARELVGVAVVTAGIIATL